MPVALGFGWAFLAALGFEWLAARERTAKRPATAGRASAEVAREPLSSAAQRPSSPPGRALRHGKDQARTSSPTSCRERREPVKRQGPVRISSQRSARVALDSPPRRWGTMITRGPGSAGASRGFPTRPACRCVDRGRARCRCHGALACSGRRDCSWLPNRDALGFGNLDHLRRARSAERVGVDEIGFQPSHRLVRR